MAAGRDRTLLLLVVICSSVCLIHGQTFFYLDGSAPFDGPGISPSNPFNNFASAWNALDGIIQASSPLTANCTLFVKAGTYTSVPDHTFTTFGSSKALSIIGTEGTPVISCGGSTTWMTFNRGGSGTARFSISNMKITSCGGALAVNENANVMIDSVVFDGISGGNTSPVEITGASIAATISITNSQFLNSHASTSTNAVLYIATSISSTASISNCVFKDNSMDSSKATLGTAVPTTITHSEFSENDLSPSATFTSVLNIQKNDAGNMKVIIRDCTINENNVENVIATSASFSGLKVDIKGDTEITENDVSGAVINTQSDSEIVTIDIIGPVITQNNPDKFSCTAGSVIQDSLNNNLCNAVCSGSSFDRCYVCNGPSACLGCDGVPYSQVVCTNPTGSSEDDNNTDTSDSVALWRDNSPNAQLLPVAGSSQFINITLGTIEERTNTGVGVRSLDLSSQPWVVSVPQQVNTDQYVRVFRYFATDGSNLVIKITQTLFRVPSSVDSGGVSFSVDQNSLKFSLEISHWNFASLTNTLSFSMSFQTSEGRVSESTSSVTINGYQISTVSVDTPNTKVSVNLQHWAVFDNVTKEIQVNLASSTATTSTYEFVLPSQFTVMDYDPDFGVVLSPSSSSGGGGDGSSDNSGLIIGLTVGLVCAALLVVLVVVLGSLAAIYWKVLRQRHFTKMRGSTMVNFHNDIEQENSSSSD